MLKLIEEARKVVEDWALVAQCLQETIETETDQAIADVMAVLEG